MHSACAHQPSTIYYLLFLFLWVLTMNEFMNISGDFCSVPADWRYLFTVLVSLLAFHCIFECMRELQIQSRTPTMCNTSCKCISLLSSAAIARDLWLWLRWKSRVEDGCHVLRKVQFKNAGKQRNRRRTTLLSKLDSHPLFYRTYVLHRKQINKKLVVSSVGAWASSAWCSFAFFPSNAEELWQ